MRARMQEISVFYDENLDDSKIHFFEKLRLRIKKALFNRPGKKQMIGHNDTTNQDLYNTLHHGEDFFERQMLSHQEEQAWGMQAKQMSAHKEESKDLLNIPPKLQH